MSGSSDGSFDFVPRCDVPERLVDLPGHPEPVQPHSQLSRYGTAAQRLIPLRPDDFRLLNAYSWPGNVRELQNVVERANFIRALEATGWKVAGDGGAAALLGLPPSTLASRLRSLRIRRPGSS